MDEVNDADSFRLGRDQDQVQVDLKRFIRKELSPLIFLLADPLHHE